MTEPQRKPLSSAPFLLAALLLATVAAWPLLQEPGLLNTRGGGDSPFLLQRLHQLETAVLDGHFPARWMPDANYGYGYPFYNFYAPLSIYITLLFRFVGFSFVRAIHLSQLAAFWGSLRLLLTPSPPFTLSTSMCVVIRWPSFGPWPFIRSPFWRLKMWRRQLTSKRLHCACRSGRLLVPLPSSPLPMPPSSSATTSRPSSSPPSLVFTSSN
mgnify:CR=1 FL=1